MHRTRQQVGEAYAFWAAHAPPSTGPMPSLTMALEVMCHPFIDGQTCVFGGAIDRLRWNFFSFLPSFLSLYLRFHINPFENKMCHVSLYLYQFWSSFFLFIFVLLLMLFEINFFFNFISRYFISFIFFIQFGPHFFIAI